MKFLKANPCKECPFRKTAIKGWLGPDTAEQVLQKVHGEGGYVCHTSIEGGRTKNARQCVGAILHADLSFKLYQNPQLRALQDKLDGKANKDKILDSREFLEHHKHSFIERAANV